MSVIKLLSRIVAPSIVMGDLERTDLSVEHDQVGNQHAHHMIASSLHDHTYGITSDPLTQFAVVFSALIHDVDHQGVPNITLVHECANIAVLYGGKSVAEQNSVDLAWDLLMNSRFRDLRNAIYATDSEARRFR
jgi:3'5'-cyclic nucleotide phosphodiesterase